MALEALSFPIVRPFVRAYVHHACPDCLNCQIVTYSQQFDGFWWNLARWQIFAPWSRPTVNISSFCKSKMAAADILKNQKKIATSRERFDQSSRNLARWWIMGLLTAPYGWLGSWVVSVLDLGAVGPEFKSQQQRCRVTVLGKLFTPVVPLFTKQRNW